MAIINGRRINPNNIPHSGVYGREIINQSGNGGKSNRRPVLQKGGLQFESIDPNKKYSKNDLQDKNGYGVKISDMPDRTKGASFGNGRTPLSKHVITEQAYDLAENLFKQGIDFDEEGANYIVIPNYSLPKNWHHIVRSTALLVMLPKEYPAKPPIGFYMMADIPQSPNGHFYNQAYHEADMSPLEQGWKWYCVYIPNGGWQPAMCRRPNDWKKGDNLWTYFTLINEVLASGD